MESAFAACQHCLSISSDARKTLKFQAFKIFDLMRKTTKAERKVVYNAFTERTSSFLQQSAENLLFSKHNFGYRTTYTTSKVVERRITIRYKVIGTTTVL